MNNNAVNLNGTLTLSAGGVTTSLGNGTVTLASGTQNVNVFFGTLDIGGVLTGSSASTLNWYGSGTLGLNNSNAFAGTVIISGNNGTLSLNNTNALANAIVNKGSNNTLAFGVAGSNTYNIAGLFGSGGIALGANTLDLNTTVSNNYYTGILSGTGGLIVEGSGTSSIAGANTYSGGTVVNGGLVNFNTTGTMGSGSLTVNGGTVDFWGRTITNSLAGLNGGSIINGTLTNDGGVFAVQSGAISAALAGSNGLTKSGSGTVTLSGANTYSGQTTISAGTLLLGAGASLASTNINLGTSGSPGTLDVSSKSSYTLTSAQTLSGSGLVNIGSGKTLTINGGVNPGNSPGIINVTGNVVLGSNSISTFEIFGTNAGTGYDQFNVTGNLTYGGTLNLIASNAIVPLTGTNFFSLFTATGTYTPNLTNVALAGSWTASFTNGGSGFWSYNDSLNNLQWQFNELNGQLAVAAIPEPADLVYFGGLISAALLIYRRRKNRE